MLYQDPSQPAPEPQRLKPAKLPDDEIRHRLREAARRRRPWNVPSIALTVLLIAGPVALLAWWYWPRPEPPQLAVTAFDQVVVQGHAVTVRAATHPKEGEERWGGRQVYFKEWSLQGTGGRVPATTDDNGIASLTIKLESSAQVAEVEAKYVDNAMRPPWEDTGRVRVFQWPADARLLVVDVETLPKTKAQWPAFAAALTTAKAAGWKLVYLAAAADTPGTYRKLHDITTDLQSLEHDALPDGPVLGRLTLFEEQVEAAARTELLAALKTQFAGPVVYVALGDRKVWTVQAGGRLAGQPKVLAEWGHLVDALPK